MEPPGLYRTVGAPGSAAALSDRKRAAWPCRVTELRFQGVYLPADLILKRPLHTGWIISKDVGATEWISEFCTSLKPDEDRAPIPPLFGIRSVRQNADGTYLLQGMAWDAGYLQRWEQDWLCGPGDDSVTAALRKMDPWLRQRYTGVYRGESRP